MSVFGKAIILFFLLIQVVVIASCGSIGRRQPHELFDLNSYEMSSPKRDEISRLVTSLKQKNAALATYKGIGKVKLWNNKRVISSRAAWIGDSPLKLRLEMLGIHGGPIASVAINGQSFYYYSHADKQYYARPLTDDGLKPFVSFSLPVEVVTCLLMGRIPVYTSYRAAKIMENPSGEGFILTLVSKDSKKAQKIFLNREKTSIFRVEYYDKNGSLEVSAALSNHRMVESFEIPFAIAISDGKGSGLKMDIDRYWTGIPVEPSVFVLSRNAG
jgi:hypothetical protein